MGGRGLHELEETRGERVSRVHAATRGVTLEAPYAQDIESICFTFPQFMYFYFCASYACPKLNCSNDLRPKTTVI